MKKSLTQIQGVDIVKYIMAFAVIAIHIQSPCHEYFCDPIEWFIRLAVPYFFITSGFLVARKLDGIDTYSEKENTLKKRGIEIFRLFGIWLLIYITISTVYSLYQGTSISVILKSMISSVLIRGEIMYAWPLWFLYSLGIYTFALSWCVGSWFRMLALSAFSLIFLFGEFVINNLSLLGLSDTSQDVFKYLPIRVLSGGGYIIAGIICYYYQGMMRSLMVPIVLILISMLLFIGDLPFNPLFGGVGMFLFACKLPVKNKPELCLSLRYQSMWIYYLHMIFIIATLFISEIIGTKLDLWPTYLSVSLITALTALGLSYLQNIPHFKILARLVR